MELSETRFCQFADRCPEVRLLLDESGKFTFDKLSKRGIYQVRTQERHDWQFQRLSSG
ncbi:hypothetical protein [Oscillatoria acuminata]|uniref:hypothetical protein n=1 Tax=Oscillatoria acuminata TaxID=118323 RepID=UPI0002D72491|nr:hypothetical protein [Oscillatoria acuminata]